MPKNDKKYRILAQPFWNTDIRKFVMKILFQNKFPNFKNISISFDGILNEIQI